MVAHRLVAVDEPNLAGHRVTASCRDLSSALIENLGTIGRTGRERGEAQAAEPYVNPSTGGALR